MAKCEYVYPVSLPKLVSQRLLIREGFGYKKQLEFPLWCKGISAAPECRLNPQPGTVG